MEEMYPFRQWCRRRQISPAQGYNFLRQGRVRAVKVASRTFITESEDQRFVENLPAYEPRSGGVIKRAVPHVAASEADGAT